MEELSIRTKDHSARCHCNLADLNLFMRGYLSVFKTESTQPCKLVGKWLEKCRVKAASEEIYLELLETPVDFESYQKSAHQIELDLLRTYPDEEYFSGPGKASLRRVLLAFAKYDPVLGYVQGMNFIVAALLWHATEAQAFWLTVSLMEDYELRENYMPGFPGLSKHAQIIHILTFKHLPSLHCLFANFNVKPEMYLTEWVISLFGSLLSINDMGFLLDQFFSQGWMFFYKLVLSILCKLQFKLLASEDFMDILKSLKPIRRTQKDIAAFVGDMNRGLSWRALIAQASEVKLDSAYIHYLLLNFNVDTAQFGRFAFSRQLC